MSGVLPATYNHVSFVLYRSTCHVFGRLESRWTWSTPVSPVLWAARARTAGGLSCPELACAPVRPRAPIKTRTNQQHAIQQRYKATNVMKKTNRLKDEQNRRGHCLGYPTLDIDTDLRRPCGYMGERRGLAAGRACPASALVTRSLTRSK